MPAAASSAKASSRRKEKHLSPEELKDIEQKRLKGELSCAECRRLKLRCDKKVPCSSCSRRGCESICPCGILEAGVGTRFILASTDLLHSKISLMSSRIRALEDAVAIFQASVSSERHPLLEDELLKIKFGSEVKNSEESEILDSQTEGHMITGSITAANRSADATTLDAFGTLTLGEEGEMKYFGRSAGSETLILAGEKYVDSDEEESIPTSDSRHPQDQSDIPNGSDATTFTPGMSPATSFFHALSSSEEDKNTVPPEVYALALDFNQGTQAQSSLTVSDLLAHLPPRSHAETLAQSYIDHASLFFRATKKDELFDVVLPLLYPSSISLSESMSVPKAIDSSTSQTTMPTHSDGSNNHRLPSPHLLAAVYFTFALGSFFDLSASIKIYVSESQRWFELGRKALVCNRGVNVHSKTHFEGNTHIPHQLSSDDDIHAPHPLDAGKTPSIFAAAPSSAEDTVRALGLMATYCSMSGKKHARDSAWCGMSLAAKVAQGSDRDPARWHMDPVTVQRRRALWWEVCTSDISHSVALGRPPSIHLSFVDCEFPTDEEATLSDTGEEVMGFWRMKYTFAKESFAPVISTTLSAKSPTYSTIVDLDRKIRELSLPPGFKPYVSLYEDGPEIYHHSHLALRDFYASQHRTVTMLYLHRSFFAHAMLTHPSNPLMSPFALSFLAAYRAASVIIKAAVHFYDRCSAVVPRVWFLTYHVFSAAMTVGTVVKRSPNSSIAKSALNDLGQALNLFEKCASSSPRNRIAYALLRRLKGKADRAYASFLSNKKEPASISPKASTIDPCLFSRTPNGADDNELAIWGGKTSLLNGLGKRKVKESVSSPTQQIPATFPPHQGGVNNSAPAASLYSETSWNDAMDAQMDFDANLDLSSLFSMDSTHSTAASLPQMPSTMASTAMDVNADALLSNVGNVDFGFSLGFGAGTTGSRGLLMDMALEDIGPDLHIPASSTSNYLHQNQTLQQAAETNKQLVLMEYLSETANPTSAQLLPGGLLGPLYNTASANALSTMNTSLPWANFNALGSSGGQFDIGSGSPIDMTSGVGESGIMRRESDANIAELYMRLLNYLASKESPGTQNSVDFTASMPVDPISTSMFPGLNWSEHSLSSNENPPTTPSASYDMFFDSLMGSGPINENNTGDSLGANLRMGDFSGLDPGWATFMRDLARSGS
ncbi:hypothetical protein F5890DRAFT_829049 [Lentinula detonsa]|uniref:Zn(2)-C6 fungal-type domain-containing protein n=1 Tax=Lentinula detonsa TaxID=2804962 RepID=A0AA38UMG7_9AGAR|nr:hypothetical protein F5890DRAFT_829049 [Lentinula detonsa]